MNYFTDVTTPDQAYALGLLAADGNIASVKPRVQIGLVSRDMRAVEFVRDRLNPAAPLCPLADGRMVLHITSAQMVADLARYGIGPRKSRTVRWPAMLPAGLQRSFLRGYFDGDGSACLAGGKYPDWSVCSGSRQLLADMKEYVRASAGIVMQKIQPRLGTGLFQVATTGWQAVVADEWLHQDGMGLARKRFPGHVTARYRAA